MSMINAAKLGLRIIKLEKQLKQEFGMEERLSINFEIAALKTKMIQEMQAE